MPEKELNREEHEEVVAWLKSKSATWWQSFRNDIIGSGVYVVDNEPVVLSGRRFESSTPDPGVRFRLLCSDKHAAELEGEGWIRFETPVEKSQ